VSTHDIRKYINILSETTNENQATRIAEGPDKDYPDTAEGAIAALKDMSTHNLKGATAQPDPIVHGVWLVKYPKGKSIVYLKNGSNQPMNDFEDVE